MLVPHAFYIEITKIRSGWVADTIEEGASPFLNLKVICLKSDYGAATDHEVAFQYSCEG